MTDALYNVVISQLGYRWLDVEEKGAIIAQMQEAESFLKKYDPDCNVETDPYVRGLFITYIRYLRANASDDFRTNYRQDLIYLSDRGRLT